MASRHSSQKIASETAGIALGEKRKQGTRAVGSVFWPIIVKPGFKEHYTKAVGVALRVLGTSSDCSPVVYLLQLG